MALQRLTSLQAAILAAERPGAPLHTTAIAILDPTTIPGGYAFDTFAARLARRVSGLPILSRRVIEVPLGLARAYWVGDRDLDWPLHCRRIAAPRPGGPRELAAIVSDTHARPLDRGRPLFELSVLEGLQNGSIALIAKLHAAILEDPTGVELIAALASREAAPSSLPSPHPARYDRVPGELERLLAATPVLARQSIRATGVGAKALVQMLVRARGTREGDGAARRPIAVRSELGGRASPGRSIAYASLRLADVEAAARAHDTTAHAVVLAALAGALRRHLRARGQLPAAPLVAAILTPPEAGDGSRADGERGGGTRVRFARLATHLEAPAERVAASTDTLLDESTEPADPGILRDALDASSPIVLRAIARLADQIGLEEFLPPIANLAVSTADAPRETRFVGGARIQNLYAFGPLTGGVNLHASVVFMAASVGVGLTACRERLVDLWAVAMGLSDELSALGAGHPTKARSTSEGSAGG